MIDQSSFIWTFGPAFKHDSILFAALFVSRIREERYVGVTVVILPFEAIMSH